MNKVAAVKYIGLLGAIFSAIVVGLGGDYVTAFGMVSAALSSAGVFTPSGSQEASSV